MHPRCSHLRVAQRLLAALVRDARGLDDGLVLALARHHEERLEGDLPRRRARGGQTVTCTLSLRTAYQAWCWAPMPWYFYQA